MGGIGGKIKGFPLFGADGPLSYMDGYAAAQDISEFLPFMGIIGICGSSGLQSEPDWLHDILLGIGYDPLRFIFAGFIRFFEIIGRGENDLFLCLFAEKFIEVRPEHLKDIHQRGNGRGSEIPFQLEINPLESSALSASSS